jgi:hypothetical protein
MGHVPHVAILPNLSLRNFKLWERVLRKTIEATISCCFSYSYYKLIGPTMMKGSVIWSVRGKYIGKSGWIEAEKKKKQQRCTPM